MSQSYGERVRKDSDAIREVFVSEEESVAKVPEHEILKDGDRDVVRLEHSGPGVIESKAYKPGEMHLRERL